ncbi:MmcQ/YjbR family DNA-binding protein [Aestuariivirga litoralis]|uniref:MmcQ/YjbR family DNA-binding protein n=1 Tax=Aestuariivirga litoralis TaxID=2650924 RepID=UPI0018C74283|nr:MmcQ/YjbR family DNA-binding protein [Aestuariivirga litoralis]MBG1233698.1 MmcQ/YjbR family DNA-binding protein [Aestuariivirga litoralis]
MSIELFRRLALALPGVEEKSHFGKADFRVKNKIFGGLSAKGMAYVKLKPEEQEMLCGSEPGIVVAHDGHWGRQGWTFVDQDKADEALLKSALQMAWTTVTAKKPKKTAK